MKFASKLITAVLTLVLFAAGAMAQSQSDDPNRTPSPTIIGATGMFTIIDATTMKRGEFNFGFFYNNFKRDPGSVHIENMPVNFAVGFGRVELFANIDLNQTVTVRAPDALSGFQLPNVISPGFFQGFAAPTATTPFFTFNGLPFVTGAIRGNTILPGITNGPTTTVPILVNNASGLFINVPGHINQPIPGFGPFCNQAADPNCRQTVFPVPLFLFDRDVLGFQGINAEYLNNYPFIGRGSGNGLGDVDWGGKVRLNSNDSKLTVSLMGLMRIPTITADKLFSSTGLERGRGAGAIDWGAYALFSGHFRNMTLTSNIGYMHDGDPSINGVQVLDRADEIHVGAGLELPFKRYFQFVTEITDEAYVGHRTPNINQKNPLEYRAGIRFYPRTWIQLGASYQVLLNPTSDLADSQKPFVNVNQTNQVIFVPRTIASSDPNGIIAYIAFGLHRTEKPAPIIVAANQPPTVNCAATPSSVTKGVDNPVITISTEVRDPENDVVTYSWSASGGASVSGNGGQVTVNTANLPVGSYTVTVTVDDGHGHPVQCSATFSVTEKPNHCPTVTLRADPSVVEAGTNTRINLTANGVDQDGDQLTYQWSTTQGSISGSGPNVSLDTTGLSGNVTVSVSVSDGKCNGSDSTTITINAKPPVPVATIIGNCITYPRSNVTRADNACKAILQDVAAKLQQDPRATVTIQGFADANERTSAAQARAEAVRDFLINMMHIDANRIKVVALGSQASSNAVGGNNRVVTIWFVPEGAAQP